MFDVGTKRELFKLYSENFHNLIYQIAKNEGENFDEEKLKLVFPKMKETIKLKNFNVFKCPLCGRYFATDEPDEVDFNDFTLTVEHVPPECMGNLIKTMTCKDCNNYLGSFEGKLEKSLRRKDRWEEDNITRGRVSFGNRDKEIGIEAKFTDEGPIHLNTVEEISNKDAIEELTEKISDGFDFSLHTFIPEVDERKLIAVLYKNALLTAFYVFGYAYPKSASVQKVKTQILNPEKEIIPTKGIAVLNNISKEFSYPLIGWSNVPVKALYVTFPLEVEDNKKFYTVPLPGPGPEENFKKFTSEIDSRTSGEEVNFKLHLPYEVPAGNTLELVKDLGTKVVYRFWQEIA